MLSISPLQFPKSWHEKISLPFFLSSVLDQFFFLLIIVCPQGQGINVTEGSSIPHGNCRLESLTMQSKFLREGQEYAWEHLLFLIHTPSGSYNRALKNLCSLFHFCCSLSIAVNCTNCVLEMSNSSPLFFLQFYFIKVSFMQTTLLHNLCSITLLQLEARW